MGRWWLQACCHACVFSRTSPQGVRKTYALRSSRRRVPFDVRQRDAAALHHTSRRWRVVSGPLSTRIICSSQSRCAGSTSRRMRRPSRRLASGSRCNLRQRHSRRGYRRPTEQEAVIERGYLPRDTNRFVYPTRYRSTPGARQSVVRHESGSQGLGATGDQPQTRRCQAVEALKPGRTDRTTRACGTTLRAQHPRCSCAPCRCGSHGPRPGERPPRRSCHLFASPPRWPESWR